MDVDLNHPMNADVLHLLVERGQRMQRQCWQLIAASHARGPQLLRPDYLAALGWRANLWRSWRARLLHDGAWRSD